MPMNMEAGTKTETSNVIEGILVLLLYLMEVQNFHILPLGAAPGIRIFLKSYAN